MLTPSTQALDSLCTLLKIGPLAVGVHEKFETHSMNVQVRPLGAACRTSQGSNGESFPLMLYSETEESFHFRYLEFP